MAWKSVDDSAGEFFTTGVQNLVRTQFIDVHFRILAGLWCMDTLRVQPVI